jgi:hypothetical protein
MNPQTKRLIGNIILAIAILIVLINLAGMSGIIAKPWPTRDSNFIAIALLVVARILRGRRRLAAAPPVDR